MATVDEDDRSPPPPRKPGIRLRLPFFKRVDMGFATLGWAMLIAASFAVVALIARLMKLTFD